MADNADGFFRDWHFRKEFHAGHILATVMMVAALIAGWVNLEVRLAELSQRTLDTERRIEIMEEILREDDTAQRLARIEVALERQTVTIERLLDRYDREAEREQP